MTYTVVYFLELFTLSTLQYQSPALNLSDNKDNARKVGMMGVHHLWERKELSWVACCPSKCPEAGL